MGMTQAERAKYQIGNRPYEDFAICPFCGNIDHNSFELNQSDTCECDECGCTYTVEREEWVTYNTAPLQATEEWKKARLEELEGKA